MRDFDYAIDTHLAPKKTNWFTLGLLLMLTFVVLIGGVELFWYYFAGGLSPILGAFAFMAALLVAVRVIGEKVVARHRGHL